MAHEGRKLEVTLRNVWSGWCVPYFNLPSYAYCEMPTRRRESDRGDFAAKREVVEYDATRNIGEDCATVFIDREEEVSARVESQACDVLPVRKRKRV